MLRIVCTCLLMAAAVAAQDAPAAPAAASPPGLAELEKTVQKKTDDWNRLAQNLEGLIIRLLPCDPKAVAAITEVSKASDARLAAIADYLDAANRQAQSQTNAAKQVLASVQGLGAELAGEKSDLAPERAGVEGQTSNLNQSARNRASFAAAQDSLKQISAVEQQRTDTIDSAMSHADLATMALGDLVAQLQTRQAAWNDVQTAFGSEAARWTQYYAARLARARTECAITKGTATPAAPPRNQGKQK